MSSDSPPPPPDVWQSKNMDIADADFYGRVQGFGNQPNYAAMEWSRAQPAFQGVFQPGGYNPADTNARGGALAAQGQAMMPYGMQALQTGFDPQNELYGRAAHNLEQQTRRALEARGVNSTPYGAGIEGQTMANFNMDWADRALGRQQTAANTAGSVYGTGASMVGQGDAMQRGVPSWQAQMLQALQGAGGQNYAYPQAALDAYRQYMQMGMGGDQNALSRHQQQLKAFEIQQAQDAAMWQALGSLGGSALSMATNPMSVFGTKLWG